MTFDPGIIILLNENPASGEFYAIEFSRKGWMADMNQEDTELLLKECSSGVQMAVGTIDDVLDRGESERLKEILNQNKNRHSELGNQLHDYMNRMNEEQKEPNPMGKAMSWLKTNMKLAMEPDDKAIAGIIFDGCNMGIKSLYKYLNQYSEADGKAKEMAHKIIDLEEELREQMTDWL